MEGAIFPTYTTNTIDVCLYDSLLSGHITKRRESLATLLSRIGLPCDTTTGTSLSSQETLIYPFKSSRQLAIRHKMNVSTDGRFIYDILYLHILYLLQMDASFLH